MTSCTQNLADSGIGLRLSWLDGTTQPLPASLRARPVWPDIAGTECLADGSGADATAICRWGRSGR